MVHFQLRHDETLAQVRLGAVVRDRDRVLLHRPVLDDGPWAVPGGRLEIGEDAASGLVREFREELEVEVTVGPLLCVVENFFKHWPLDGPPPDVAGARTRPRIHHHELGLYFAVEVPTWLGDGDRVVGVEAAGTDHAHELDFRWIASADLDDLDVRPHALRPYLGADPPPPRTLVQRA